MIVPTEQASPVDGVRAQDGDVEVFKSVPLLLLLLERRVGAWLLLISAKLESLPVFLLMLLMWFLM